MEEERCSEAIDVHPCTATSKRFFIFTVQQSVDTSSGAARFHLMTCWWAHVEENNGT